MTFMAGLHCWTRTQDSGWFSLLACSHMRIRTRTPTLGTEIHPKNGYSHSGLESESEFVQCENYTWYNCSHRETPPNPSPNPSM